MRAGKGPQPKTANSITKGLKSLQGSSPPILKKRGGETRREGKLSRCYTKSIGSLTTCQSIRRRISHRELEEKVKRVRTREQDRKTVERNAVGMVIRASARRGVLRASVASIKKRRKSRNLLGVKEGYRSGNEASAKHKGWENTIGGAGNERLKHARRSRARPTIEGDRRFVGRLRMEMGRRCKKRPCGSRPKPNHAGNELRIHRSRRSCRDTG